MTDQFLQDLTAALGQAYQIERELPGGGMSRIFVAREHALGREVVIKVLPHELAAGINRERFRREVQLAARITHPYIVPLLNAGEAGTLLWFTMPYISGDSLRTRLEEKGPLPVREVIQLLRDVVEALAYAHARGVIHRDIKPANILTDGVHALVTDFGVAKALGASLPLTGVAGHTTSGVAIGTPAYMAPEQLAADPAADHRVDIYATGLLAYELLTGASPFAAPSPTATMTAQLTRTPVSLSTLRSDVPPALARLVESCLAKSPEHRPANASAVLADLDRISGALAADAHREGSGDFTQPQPRAASSLPLALAALGAIGLVAAGIWWTGRGPAAPGTATIDTMPVLVGNDTGQAGEPLPESRPLTRADSLAIAAALRDELERIDPVAAERVPRAAPLAEPATGGSVTVTLEQQLSMADSLVRSRLAELTSAATAARAMAGRPTPPGVPSIGPTPGTERKSVMVVAASEDGDDPRMQQLAEQIAAELKGRLERGEQWEVVPPTLGASVRGGHLPAEVLVVIGVSQEGDDSASARLVVRNLTPGSEFGFNAVTSRSFALADGARGYRGTLAQAYDVLSNLRRLDRGQRWKIDMGP